MTEAQHHRLHALLPGVRTLWDERDRWDGWHVFSQALLVEEEDDDVWDD
jgi:hypothetical protein